MSSFLADNINLLTYSLFVSWVLISVPFIFRNRSSFVKTIAMIVILLAVRFIPIYSFYSLSYIMYGAFGNLSIVTLLLLAYFIYAEINHDNSLYHISPVVFIILIILAALLYLSVFGYIEEDIYAWGYYPSWMLILYLAIQVLFSLKSRLFAILWLIALICFVFKLENSINFWDYLFDPILISISIFYFLYNIVRQLIRTITSR